ncbi:MAG TPA: hypothetical protein VFE78_37530 [Gemmataceae bacterium]|nr:hypothetical protein [Gemmataceae bacterium]
MSRSYPFALALTVLCVAAGPREAPAADGLPAQVTFSEHVAPIVFNNCTTCHRPGESAPFTLMNYRDVQKRGKTMLRVVERHYMPPWPPAAGFGEFRDERRLDDRQVALLKRWVETGMAVGDPKKLPKLPDFPQGWALGKPDLVVQMDKEYTVPADGPDIYRNFVLPLNLPEDKWVTAVDVKPSARKVVHHLLYFLDGRGEARKRDGKDGQPGFEGMSNFLPTGSLGGWAVGATPRPLPNGLAWPLPKGSDLVVQTHFHPSGKVEKETLTVGLYFATKPPTRKLTPISLPPAFARFEALDIPPGKADYTLRDQFTLPMDVDLVGVGSHAHYVGKTMKAVAELPDKSTRRLYHVPDWDFNWQGQYLYKDYVRLPKGTVIRVEITYDNSEDNPRNPSSPPKRIMWGENTTDEMGSVRFLAVAADEKDAPALQKAVREHVRKAYVRAVLRGEKFDQNFLVPPNKK